MKLQKLTIHNIASIEDAAIDFEARPLADSEVFLITGKTGAGKSTILDAICLALFADTPRLKGTLMEGKTTDVDNTIGVDDPRQLMRRNTGEAFVSLTFTGSNDVHYEATWGVRRAHGKSTGNLQRKRWMLTNIDAGLTYDRDGDIATEIKTAVGLDFNQFCRTTLLAQGEFTRFLNSKDEEKAAILEKITGVDIYTKVGKKVFEITAQKKLIWDEARQRADSTHTLTEEEVAAKKEEMTLLDNQLESVKLAADKDKVKLNWIKVDAELDKLVKTATEDYKQAKAIVDGEEFKKQKLLVEQWNDTIDARSWLNAKKRAEQDKALQLSTLSTLKSDYVAVLGGYVFSENEKKKIETDIRNIASLIESEKEKATVYDNAQTIVGYLMTIAEGRDKIETSQSGIAEENKALTEKLQPAFDKVQKEVDEAQRTFERQESDLRIQEKELAEFHLDDRRKQRDKAQELLQNIATAYVRIEFHAKEKERMDREIKTLEETWAEIERKRKESGNMEPWIHDAKVKMDACREMLDKQSDTIDKFAKTLRQKLQVGDVCPVCRQEIRQELPREEELVQFVGALKEACMEAEAAYKKLVEGKNKLDAEISSLTRSFQVNKEKIDKDKSVEISSLNMRVACKACGQDTVDGETPMVLKSLKEKTEETLKELNAKISEGESKDKAIREQRTKLDKLRKYLEQLKNTAQKAQQAINDCKGRITTAQEMVRTKTDEIKKAEENAASYITGQWNMDWKANPKAFLIELKKQTICYQENVRQKQLLDTRLVQMTNDSQMVKGVMAGILQLMPEWKELTASEIVKLSALLEKANDVKNKISIARVQLGQAEEAIRSNALLIEEFLVNHEGLDIERLTDLNAYTPQAVNGVNSLLRKDTDKVLEKKTLMDEAAKKLEMHRQERPELKEEDTIETLETLIKIYDSKLVEVSAQKGAVNQELKDDEKKKKELGLLIEDAEQKRTDYQRWSRLNQLIGDATGNKFRKIAQSYVLNSLIHSANNYMKTLTDRYVLKVVPGTFVISLEDAYQGYVSRAASTISGGESFLVSLSLALALSDIGQQLSVDTLFIDEGFGTLSGESLQSAINTLRSLHNKSGRHVGIISHVQELRECIPVQIRVDQHGNNSSSKVNVVNIFSH